MEYLLDEHYEIAAANGICKKYVYQRVYEYGWEIKRAITQPVKKYKTGIWEKWKAVCEKNGIKKRVFHLRIHKYNMSPEEAATRPLLKHGDNFKKYYARMAEKREKSCKLN